MPLTWTRPSFEAEPGRVDEEIVSQRKAEAPGEWVLLVGESESALEAAARSRIEATAISPPGTPLLPIAVHELPPPGLEGERLLYVPRIDRSFSGNPSFAPTSPLYLIPALARLAAEGTALSFVATAIESELEARAKDVLAQRGLASRFEIRRVAGEPSRREEPPLELDLSSVSPESGLAALFLAGDHLAARERGKALAALERAIGIAPGLAAGHYELGKLRLQLDDMEGALASFLRTVELLPEYSSAWGNLGAALGEIQDLDRSLAALDRAVLLDPLSHAMHSNRGACLRDLGRLEEAEECFRKTLALEPGFVFGHYNLGHTLYLRGRFDDAIASFESGRALDPSRSPRQSLLLAVTRLAAGDREGAETEYRDVFTRLDPPMKADMRTVAEWDLKQLSKRSGVTDDLKEAAGLLRSLA
jgi:tetratricopeptide (TPR) repeat protein